MKQVDRCYAFLFEGRLFGWYSRSNDVELMDEINQFHNKMDNLWNLWSSYVSYIHDKTVYASCYTSDYKESMSASVDSSLAEWNIPSPVSDIVVSYAQVLDRPLPYMVLVGDAGGTQKHASQFTKTLSLYSMKMKEWIDERYISTHASKRSPSHSFSTFQIMDQIQIDANAKNSFFVDFDAKVCVSLCLTDLYVCNRSF